MNLKSTKNFKKNVKEMFKLLKFEMLFIAKICTNMKKSTMQVSLNNIGCMTTPDITWFLTFFFFIVVVVVVTHLLTLLNFSTDFYSEDKTSLFAAKNYIKKYLMKCNKLPAKFYGTQENCLSIHLAMTDVFYYFNII